MGPGMPSASGQNARVFWKFSVKTHNCSLFCQLCIIVSSEGVLLSLEIPEGLGFFFGILVTCAERIF